VSAEAVKTATFLSEHPEELAPVVGFLAAHERRHGAAASPSYALVGVDEHDRIELPGAVHEALTKVVAALHAGKAVTIAPQTMTLTTQQAADLLGVSRPTVVRLINDNVLPAERIRNRHASARCRAVLSRGAPHASIRCTGGYRRHRRRCRNDPKSTTRSTPRCGGAPKQVSPAELTP
jgi:excisionase family DNA binding protein